MRLSAIKKQGPEPGRVRGLQFMCWSLRRRVTGLQQDVKGDLFSSHRRADSSDWFPSGGPEFSLENGTATDPESASGNYYYNYFILTNVTRLQNYSRSTAETFRTEIIRYLQTDVHKKELSFQSVFLKAELRKKLRTEKQKKKKKKDFSIIAVFVFVILCLHQVEISHNCFYFSRPEGSDWWRSEIKSQ